ncbi:MAG: hypothetical protein ABIO91_04095 [Pyrinomonadaceae bacterium]
MRTITIEKLLKAANSSTESDSSINVAKRVLLEQSACDVFFESTRRKLLDINEWNKNSSATAYRLFDDGGKPADSEPISVGVFIRLNLSGSGKYDWVRVVSIIDEPDEFIVRVRPSYDPTAEPRDTASTSHFFGPDATNNFCVQRVGKTVAFYVIGLNEKQNTKFTGGLIESARNSAVANIGYYSGIQKAVWKEVCSNFLSTDEEKAS